MSNTWVRSAAWLTLFVAGCNSKVIVDDAGRAEAVDFGNPDSAVVDFDPATRAAHDAGPADGGRDAFIVDDPALPYCGPDGERREPENPGGTAECPADKNREGCVCPEAGQQAACWPGRRRHRNQGICADGTTVCLDTIEFGLHWGPCEGYVLPKEDAESGPDACSCFSRGRWELDNLVPCLQEQGDNVFMYSSALDEEGDYVCQELASPPAAPEQHWADSVLNIDCEGRFQLCYTIKAGDDGNPDPDDCIVTRQCFDIWYEEARTDLPLRVPGWASRDGACGRRFADIGGYGEMTVQGLSVQCDEVDDGEGNPRVFFRTNYCPPDCATRPEAEECKACTTGGASDF